MNGYPFFLNTEAEFLSIAEKLKPFTEEKMKMEPFPWFEGHLINMDELYTELTLEKVEKKLLREKRKELRRYDEMFNCSQSEYKNRKVLMKADPGMGKTTLGRKMSWDWARGKFKKFSMVFFVALKLVKPGDPIEKVIMQQHPELDGLGVSQQKLKVLLNRFSSRILIIFDGLDEHRLGQNKDVLKIIKNQMLLDCRIVVSSRPHSAKEVEEHFPTVIRVEGFTETEARKFVSKFFDDQNKITQILQFKPSDSRENFPIHKCPILLSFLCLLVTEKEINLLDTKLTIGELYFKMVQCLYKKFTIRKGMTFNQSKFVQVLKSVGKLALQTLKANNPLLQRSEVERIVGDHAFEYGFFTGHEDFRPCTDPTVDICVTFAHRSIEEFFGSFGFLQALDDGQSIDDILGSDCEKPMFMVNPLVLRFCLWLRTEFFGSQRIVYDKLVVTVAQQIDTHVLNIHVLDEIFPAMDIREALRDEDNLKLEFFKQVFEKCEQVRVLQVRDDQTFEGHLMYSGHQVHQAFGTHVLGVLGLISRSLLSKLSLLLISGGSPPHALPDLNSDALTVSIDSTGIDHYLEISEILQTRHDLLNRDPQMCATIYFKKCQDIKILMQKNIKELHVSNSDQATLSTSGEFPFCPQFTHFTAYGFHIDDSVPAAFIKAVKEGKLPNLRRIELNSCTMSDCDWPEVPEFFCEFWNVTMSDSSQIQKLLLKLTELTVWEYKEKPLHLDRLIPVHLENLSVLKLILKSTDGLQSLNNVLKQGALPNLSKLVIDSCYVDIDRYSVLPDSDKIHREICQLESFLDEFEPHQTAKLEKLALQWFKSTISAETLKILSEKLAAVQLTELDLSFSSGLTGRLSVLFTHSFPTLNTLILRSCDLNANDLQSLARANVVGKLPQLRHLDISDSGDDTISDLFTHSAQWNQLKTLGTSNGNILNLDPEFLTSLEELCLRWLPLREENPLPPVTRCWSGLKTIQLEYEEGLPYIVDGVERGMFPDVTTVRCYEFDYYSIDKLSLFKLFKANIFVHKKNYFSSAFDTC